MTQFVKTILLYITICFIVFIVKNELSFCFLDNKIDITDNTHNANLVLGAIETIVASSIVVLIIVLLILISLIAVISTSVVKQYGVKKAFDTFFYSGSMFATALLASELLKLLIFYIYDGGFVFSDDNVYNVIISPRILFMFSVSDVICIILGIVFYTITIRKRVPYLEFADFTLLLTPFILYFSYVHYVSLERLVSQLL